MEVGKILKETKPITLLYSLMVLSESLAVKLKFVTPLQLLIILPD